MSAATVTAGRAASTPREHPALLTQVGELARRSIVRTMRQPATIIPATVFPLMLLAINSAGLQSATTLPGFPTDSYVTFALGFAFLQAGVFAVIGAGQNLAEDRESGFFNRLQLTPVRAPALLGGRLAGTMVLGLLQAATYIGVGLAAGAHVESGIAGALVLVLLSVLITLAFGSIGIAAGMRARSPEAVQGLFPVLFVFLFLSSMSMPRDLIASDWFRAVATYNPVSYMIEAIRSLLIVGWDAEALALGFGCAIAILVAGLTVSSIFLKRVMERT